MYRKIIEERDISLFVRNLRMEELQNLQRVKDFFFQKLAEIGYDGVIGAAEFKRVYDELMPIQKSKLKEICREQFQNLMKHGSIICIGIAYPEYAINRINLRMENGALDKDSWNIYAKEYHRINKFLNAIAKEIADLFGGILIPATVEGIDAKNVKDYYGLTISHRVVAENAGLGWRGKNELIVNERFSCALRFASIATNLPLIHGEKVKDSCEQCEACLEACSILKNKGKLEDYRENCRRYIVHLRLEAEVCGKCIKACYYHSIFSGDFKLK